MSSDKCECGFYDRDRHHTKIGGGECDFMAYRKRIAELEAACEKAEYELDWHSDELRKLEKEEQLFHNTLDAQQMIIEELRAEDARLRDAAQAVVDSATPHYDRWVNGVTRICINRLASLLGGGE